MHDVPVSELLRLFSEAAFFVHRDEHNQKGINSSEEILCDPLSEIEIAEIEQKLGPLPPNVKEMAIIAGGFHGG